MSASRVFKKYKGNCGLAFITEAPQLANLTVRDPFDYHLSKDEVRKTQPVKGIISVPVFEKPTGKRTPRVIGVINIDTTDTQVVDRWLQDAEKLTEIIGVFERHAKLVSIFL